MTLPITTFLAGIMGLLLVVLSARVISARWAESGDGGSGIIERRMRGQANFTEYVPVALVLFALLEFYNVNELFLMILAA